MISRLTFGRISGLESKATAPYKPPFQSCPVGLETKTLGMRLRPSLSLSFSTAASEVSVPEEISSPVLAEKDPLVLWEQAPYPSVTVAPELTAVLRAHQREGVQFMFDCLMGLTMVESGDSAIRTSGAILGDQPGLGKTLQAIALMHTLLTRNIRGVSRPAVRRALVLCPASLVKNWANEFDKWLASPAVNLVVYAVADSAQVVGLFGKFCYDTRARVLICSYETYRNHYKRLKDAQLELLVCDEAHRLKSFDTQVTQAILAISPAKRLLLTGTLVQNSLDEVLTLLSLSNPALFENASFSKYYVNPIMRGRQPGATDAQVALAKKKIADLGLITSKIILKRDNALLAAHLPPKALLFVFLDPSELQRRLYKEVATVGLVGAPSKGGQDKASPVVLTVLQTLMKLTTHPALSHQVAGAPVEAAPKIAALLEVITGSIALNERVVVISNFTQTLGLVGEILKTRKIGFLQLDGKLGAKKRQELVNRFNAPSNREFPVFLLSSLAAGCGLNIIGASRLVMLDASWNPANDAQAMARIWREGQSKKCYIYRFIVAGTIDERIIQRQLFKSSLKAAVDGEASEEAVDEGEARELMKFSEVVDTCDIHDKFLACHCGGTQATTCDRALNEDDLSTWMHERGMGSNQKEFLVKVAKFIIHCTIDLKAK